MKLGNLRRSIAILSEVVLLFALALAIRAKSLAPRGLEKRPSAKQTGILAPKVVAEAPSVNRLTRAQQAVKAYGSLPLSFEANEGQANPSVQFISHGAGYTLLLTGTGATLAVPGPDQSDQDDQMLARMDAHTRKRFQSKRFYILSPRFHRRHSSEKVQVALAGSNPI